jgi:hypothetical protein
MYRRRDGEAWDDVEPQLQREEQIEVGAGECLYIIVDDAAVPEFAVTPIAR